jgi:succinyl-diaminopimelate desuccinylase
VSDPLEIALTDIRQDAQTALLDWLKIPSISSNPAHDPDVRRSANWVKETLQRLGLQTRMVETARHPLVIAESPAISDAPVALVYGHYDVQPVEPLEKWTHPPFEPHIANGNVYARGATDDKGQVLTHLMSVAAWKRAGLALPLQIKFLLEGEEEVGSGSLDRELDSLAETLACDTVVISDNSQFAPGQPAITYGLRGICTFELHVEGPNRDLHSGSFGGAVTNPAWALSQMLASIRSPEGRIEIGGFYDDIRPLSERERGIIAELDGNDARLAGQLGVERLTGEPGFSSFERRWCRPTFDINGITSGHQGPGAKTIIPATASAKISFRTVPDQRPEKVHRQLLEHLRQHAPAGVRWKLELGHGGAAALADLDSPCMMAAEAAIERAFGRRPVFIREGGSIPIVAKMQQVLKADCLLLGWGLDDDNAHSPDEKFSLEDFHRGTCASAYLWQELGKLRS